VPRQLRRATGRRCRDGFGAYCHSPTLLLLGAALIAADWSHPALAATV
jgi:hypothetical protein